MTDRPILIPAPMVRALLLEIKAPGSGKTQTRRLAWREAKCPAHLHDDPSDPTYPAPTIWQKVKPGDRLWCRENHAFVGGGDPGLLLCEADWREAAERLGCENIPDKHPRWTPCIHMPRRFSRLTLIVTATKMERVQEISEADAIAEGLRAQAGDGRGPGAGYKWNGIGYEGGYPGCFHTPGWARRCSCEINGPSPAQCAYGDLWQSLHSKPGARWDDNPEVVALTFTVHQQNIDVIERAA